MGNKLPPKVNLEGTRLTFKTEIAFELNEHPRVVGLRKYRYTCCARLPFGSYNGIGEISKPKCERLVKSNTLPSNTARVLRVPVPDAYHYDLGRVEP